MHAEDKNAHAPIVRADPLDQRQAAEPAALQGEVDDNDVGMMTAVELVAGGGIARLDHDSGSRVLQHAPATLQDDWMVVDDEDAGHAFSPLPLPSDAVFPGSITGMAICTQVPRPVSLSTI